MVPWHEIVADLLLWITSDPYMVARLRDLHEEFANRGVEDLGSLAVDAFMFEMKVPWEGEEMTPVEAFLRTRRLDPDGSVAYPRLGMSLFGAFEVREARDGDGATLRDLLTGRDHELVDAPRHCSLVPGDTVFARLVPCHGAHVIMWVSLTVSGTPSEAVLAGLRGLSSPERRLRSIDLLGTLEDEDRQEARRSRHWSLAWLGKRVLRPGRLPRHGSNR